MFERTYFTFDIIFDRSHRKSESYTVTAFWTAGEAREEFVLPFSPTELQSLQAMGTNDILGERLFDTVFAGSVHSAYREALAVAQNSGSGLRIRLRMQDEELAALPWEWLFDPQRGQFLSLSGEIVLSRYVEEGTRGVALTPKFNYPLRLLAIISSPTDMEQLVDVSAERHILESTLTPVLEAGLLEIDYLAQATPSALQRQLRSQRYQAIHFIGHSVYDADSDSFGLAFESDMREANLIQPRSLGALLRDAQIQLLTIAHTPSDHPESHSSASAMTFLRYGLPAVVTLPNVPDLRPFVSEFYTTLLDGWPVDAAVAEGRKAVFLESNSSEWGAPLLAMKTPDALLWELEGKPEAGTSGNVSIGGGGAVVEGDVIQGGVVVGGDKISTGNTREERQAAQAIIPLNESKDIDGIRSVWKELPDRNVLDPISVLVSRFRQASEDVHAGLLQNSAYNQRLALNSVEQRLIELLQSLTSTSAAYAPFFIEPAQQWIGIIADYTEALSRQVEESQEIDNPYVPGVVLTEAQEVFVGREDVTSRIERLLLDKRRPPLLLYGQRRMGKTSLLHNLGRLLPKSVVPCFVDLQGPPGQASSHAGFLFSLARQMADSARKQRGVTLTPLTQSELSGDPFSRFDLWLDQIQRDIGSDRSILLELDEFENLDQAFEDGRLDQGQVLGMLRYMIQHRERFKLLISGSHSLREYKQWASYLINVQVIHLSYLNENEARKLVEQPLPNFPLHYDADASQRVLDVTRCHPFLVQLLCAEIVALKNEHPVDQRRHATLADVEEAIPLAMESGRFFFDDIEINQVDDAGLAVLMQLAAEGEDGTLEKAALAEAVPGENVNSVVRTLISRELIEEGDGGYRFQVEMIRRWFDEMV